MTAYGGYVDWAFEALLPVSPFWTFINVHPACERVVSLIITVPLGICAGSVPVMKVVVPLTCPPLLAEIALIMYGCCACIPITSTLWLVTRVLSAISHWRLPAPNWTVELAAWSVV